jgi:enamine deaminase RidA (YjgF/YER057c/UK114 family)
MKYYEAKLEDLGSPIPKVPSAAGAYVPAIQSSNLIFCSGQGPYKDGLFAYIGQVGNDVSLEDAYQVTRIAALKCLAEIRLLSGPLNRISHVVQFRGFVNSAPTFHDEPKVINGASELLLESFGNAGENARRALGTNNLPGNIPVEVEMVMEVE